MRSQVRAAMIFNGHTAASVDEIDEETFAEIIVMWGDGILGQRSIFDAMTPITTAVFNFMRQPSTPAYSADKIFPWVQEYQLNPDFEPTAQDKLNQSLLAYMSAAPGFKMERFTGVGSNKHQG